MTDSAAAAPAFDGDTPVNPYSLCEAVDRASRSASLAWLVLLGSTAYLTLVLAGISHRDLLLDADLTLPILQAKVPLTRFFILAPLLFVLLHLAVIGQMALLASKSMAFAEAIRLLEVSDERNHPLRHELTTFFLVQAIAGPERSRVIGALLHSLGWLSLVLFPVLCLLYLQMLFVPYHAVGITMLHRCAVLADLLLLGLVGVFLVQSESSFLRAVRRLSRQHPFRLLIAAAGLAALAAATLFIATIPGERLDRANFIAAASQSDTGASLLGQALPLLDLVFGTERTLLPRSLIVTDLDLTATNASGVPRAPLNLRGRELRFARFDRSDLRGADLSGANLDHASLIDADLRNASLQCLAPDADPTGRAAHGLRCTTARKANLTRAKLAGARLAGIDLTQASLEAARLEDAFLNDAVLASANLSGARLERASLVGGVLRGANAARASLQGADLSGAQLHLANLTNASLQGADLSRAGLEGARLQHAELDGANLSHSLLFAADLANARLAGADLTAALIWRTVPPANDGLLLADLAEIVLRPARAQDLAQLSAQSRTDDASLDASLQVRFAADSGAWAASPEHQAWQVLLKPRDASEAGEYKSRLTGYLVRLMCQSRWADGAVAAGIAKRALADGFKGDVAAIQARLKSPDCPASANISPRLLLELAMALEASRAQD
jgi:uncharacterized protein YjbI with pentapeptide repeats